MIRSTFFRADRIESFTGFTSIPEDGFLWVDIGRADSEALKELRLRYKLDPQLNTGNVYEDEQYVYLFAELVAMNDRKEPRFHKVSFVLGEKLLVTLHDTTDFPPFSRALQRLTRRSQQIGDVNALLRIILASVNDDTDQVVEVIASRLEERACTIATLSAPGISSGRELGVSDLSETMVELNKSEGFISRALESQLALARVVRYLYSEIDSEKSPQLRAKVSELIADVNGLKEHAAFEHEKVRYLQNSVVGLLTIKQNQIVKVFTIITAVFLPPTLVATFYGMNFAVMPELSWEHGFTTSIALTLVAALLPLIYIKRKGWLR